VIKANKTIVSLIMAVITMAALIIPSTINAETQITGLSLNVTPDKAAATLGDTVIYTYTLVNATSGNITSLAFSDNRMAVVLPQTDIGQSENITFTGTYTITGADFPGPVMNTTIITGKLATGDNVTAQASASITLIPSSAGLQVVKTADKSTASVNDTITYTYTITNSGNVNLKDVALTDDKLGAITLSKTTLAATENITSTKTYTVISADLPGPIVNIATVKATDPAGQVVQANSGKVVVNLKGVQATTKSQILQQSGVPGKGILSAPGLQKPFNPNSQAEFNAGKKNQHQNNGHNNGNNED
jgi:plastocyanin